MILNEIINVKSPLKVTSFILTIVLENKIYYCSKIYKRKIWKL